MNEVVNFIKSSFKYTNLVSAKNSRCEVKLANDLRKEAQKFAAVAEAEFVNGQTAQAVALTEKKESSRTLAEIAAWHFERSAAAYRRAIARFEEAAKLQTKKQKDFSVRAKQLKKSSAQIEIGMTSLSHILV